MNKLYVIKIGGNVLDNAGQLETFLKDFSAIREAKILVHGGGKIATQIGNQLGIESKYVNGRRITDEPTRDLVTMVYGGLVNRSLVATLQQYNCNAMGITGGDGNMIKAVKRPVNDTDFGFVGDIAHTGVNTALLHVLLKHNVVPVFAPLTHAGGSVLNTNADTIASVVAAAMSKHFDVRLIFCFEKKGVLTDVGNDNSVIKSINRTSYQSLLANGVLTDGMLPKMENAFAALETGVKEVLIGNAADLLQNTGMTTAGTLITNQGQ